MIVSVSEDSVGSEKKRAMLPFDSSLISLIDCVPESQLNIFQVQFLWHLSLVNLMTIFISIVFKF